MYLHTLVFLLLCTYSRLLSQESFSQSSGYFPITEKEALKSVAPFLPLNPNILPLNPSLKLQCVKDLPQANFLSFKNKNSVKSHFIVLSATQKESMLLEHYVPFMQNLKGIYIKSDNSIQTKILNRIKEFILKNNFKIFSSWVTQQQERVTFLKNDICNAIEKISTSESNQAPLIHVNSNSFEKFLKPIQGKSEGHSYHEIDFIYMINLDERPEKFAITSEALKNHGISPFRFSAVNGWKLSVSDINQLGLQFSEFPYQEKFIGTVFRYINGSELKTNELIEEPNTTYFYLGIPRGAIGIILSHLSILQDAYQSGYNTIWVMEDDVQILDDPSKIPNLIRELNQIDPQWDILFTDPNTKNKKGERVPCEAICLRPNFQNEPLSSFLAKSYRVTDDLSRIGMRYGAYSMILRRSAIVKILDFYKKYGLFLPYDLDFWLIPDLKMYCLNYDVVSTIPDALSDNWNPNYKKKQ